MSKLIQRFRNNCDKPSGTHKITHVTSFDKPACRASKQQILLFLVCIGSITWQYEYTGGGATDWWCNTDISAADLFAVCLAHQSKFKSLWRGDSDILCLGIQNIQHRVHCIFAQGYYWSKNKEDILFFSLFGKNYIIFISAHRTVWAISTLSCGLGSLFIGTPDVDWYLS